MTDLTFLALATVTIAGAVLALEARDLVYGAAALGITFLGMAGLFFLLDASYVGAFQIAVYIGAVVVLILFTVWVILLGIEIYGLNTTRNALRILFSIDLIYNAANLNIIAFARLRDPPIVTGQVLVLFTIALAAMEASVGLAIIMLVSRLNVDIDLRKLDRLKG